MSNDYTDFWNEDDDQELAAIDYNDEKAYTATEVFKNEEARVALNSLSMECDNILRADGTTPKQQFRQKYIVISDLVKQQWCEQQLLYSLGPEIYLKRVLPGEKVDIQETPEQKLVKEKGTNIHFERELEIQVPVEVYCETQEDEWAVKFLNLQFAVSSFHRGKKLAREIPVFSVPFGGDLFVYGIIDELQFDSDNYTITLTELKTRKYLSPPKLAQVQKDKYQVSMYTQLFNDLVLGKVTKALMARKLNLDMELQLSPNVRKHIAESTLRQKEKIQSLGALADIVFSQLQALPCINCAKIEYIHQDSRQSVSLLEFSIDFSSVADMFGHHLEWWHGRRETTGVDIEDCWKCGHCQFSELCEWRDVMAKKTSKESAMRFNSVEKCLKADFNTSVVT